MASLILIVYPPFIFHLPVPLHVISKRTCLLTSWPRILDISHINHTLKIGRFRNFLDIKNGHLGVNGNPACNAVQYYYYIIFLASNKMSKVLYVQALMPLNNCEHNLKTCSRYFCGTPPQSAAPPSIATRTHALHVLRRALSIWLERLLKVTQR